MARKDATPLTTLTHERHTIFKCNHQTKYNTLFYNNTEPLLSQQINSTYLYNVHQINMNSKQPFFSKLSKKENQMLYNYVDKEKRTLFTEFIK